MLNFPKTASKRTRNNPSQIEFLEPRRLLSSYALDPSFGNGGIVVAPSNAQGGFSEADPRADGTVLVNATQELTADGTLVNQPATLPPEAVPQPIQQTAQPDGKTFKFTSGGITRFNPDGSIDTSFGNAGTLSDAAVSSAVSADFSSGKVLLSGTKIYLAGTITTGIDNSLSGDPSLAIGSIAVVSLKPDGSLDHAFGNNGIAIEASSDDLNGVTDGKIGPDGTIYVIGHSGSEDTFPKIVRFDSAGDAGLDIAIYNNGLGPHPTVDLKFEQDGSYVGYLVIGESPTVFPQGATEFNLDTPVTYISNLDGTLPQLGLDGRIFALEHVATPDGPGATAIVCYRPVAAGTGTVTGHVYPTPAQVFADLNNNGSFDPGEPLTSESGNSFSLSGLAPGHATIREILPSGFTSTQPANGSFDATVTASTTANGLDFYNETSEIVVRLFKDTNGNGVLDASEKTDTNFLSQASVYIDTNANGRLDPGEPTANAGNANVVSPTNDLNYLLSGVAPGTYTLNDVPPAGFHGDSGSRAVTVAAGHATYLDLVAIPDSPTPTPSPTPVPMPTTVAGFKALLASDRDALVAAKRQMKLDIATLKRALRSDTRAAHSNVRDLNAARRKLAAAQKKGDTAMVATLNDEVIALLAGQQQLAATTLADRTNVTEATTATSVSAARQHMRDDDLAFVEFRRSRTGLVGTATR